MRQAVAVRVFHLFTSDWQYCQHLPAGKLTGDSSVFFSLRSHILRGLRGDLQMEYCSSSVNIIEVKKNPKNQLLLVLLLVLCASGWQVQTSFSVKDEFVLHLAAAGSVMCLPAAPLLPKEGRKIPLPLLTTEWHTTVANFSLPGEMA